MTEMQQALNDIHDRFVAGLTRCANNEHRIGAELKFPLVKRDGTAVPEGILAALWRFLEARGWSVERDTLTNRPIGARTAGAQNDTVASCETGYCKTEFSLAHVGDLGELDESIADLIGLLREFAEEHEVFFLGYGIHPVTPPSKQLLMKKARTSMWDKVFPSNAVVAPEDGDDVHLFTVNAASHVHVSVDQDKVIGAVNVLNAFSGAQIALLADSSVWRDAIDAKHRCVAEAFWDWWPPAAGPRSGVPEKPFTSTRDYVETVSRFKPVYVKRDGRPVTLRRYESFLDFYGADSATGEDLDGNPVALNPAPEDIGVHNSCYWFNARVSRYFTVENRVADQQPPDALLVPAAVTLGLVSALHEATEAVRPLDWDAVRDTRREACRRNGHAHTDDDLLSRMKRLAVELAELGLKRRGKGEERFLLPLRDRLAHNTCPADEAESLFSAGGAEALVLNRSITGKGYHS